MRGCWTGPGGGKEAECHMINFSEGRVEVHRKLCSNLPVLQHAGAVNIRTDDAG